MTRYELYYDGQWRAPGAKGYFPSIEPYLQKDWAQAAEADASDVDLAVRSAHNAFHNGPWSTMSGKDRATLMRKLASILLRDSEELADIEYRDNGKLRREMSAQWRAIPEWFIYFSGLADKITGKTIPAPSDNFLLYTKPEPVGVVAAITPWNSPVGLMVFKLAPALAAGCTFVVKPSEHAPISVLEFAKRFDEAGFPPGVFNVVTGHGAAGAALVSHPLVDKVAFTGSNKVGAEIAKTAGANLTRVALELGGKSPNIVFQDADLEAAANGVIAGIFAAVGQTCVAGARLIVHEAVKDELLQRLLDRVQRIVIGDPGAANTEFGPMATAQQFAHVSRLVSKAVEQGATLVTGGRAHARGGWFYEPTILSDVLPDMDIFREEVFGPVLSVTTFKTEQEAIALGNDTEYGLAAGVWTKDVHRAHRVAHRIRAGMVWVNCYRLNSYFSPFGGFKKSGWGRENGPDAINEYLETKTVWLELSGGTRDPFIVG